MSEKFIIERRTRTHTYHYEKWDERYGPQWTYSRPNGKKLSREEADDLLPKIEREVRAADKKNAKDTFKIIPAPFVDFTKPLGIFDASVRRKYDSIRVIATDRVCPVGYKYVLLARQIGMFGDEEFIYTAREDGSISGQGTSFSNEIRNV